MNFRVKALWVITLTCGVVVWTAAWIDWPSIYHFHCASDLLTAAASCCWPPRRIYACINTLCKNYLCPDHDHYYYYYYYQSPELTAKNKYPLFCSWPPSTIHIHLWAGTDGFAYCTLHIARWPLRDLQENSIDRFGWWCGKRKRSTQVISNRSSRAEYNNIIYRDPPQSHNQFLLCRHRVRFTISILVQLSTRLGQVRWSVGQSACCGSATLSRGHRKQAFERSIRN